MRSERLQQRIQFFILVLFVSVALSAGGIVLTHTVFGEGAEREEYGSLRLQVIPHSDRPSDQDLKLFVRDRLLAALRERLPAWGDSVEEVAERLENETPWIAETVAAALADAGRNLSFRIVVDRLPALAGVEGGGPQQASASVDAPGGVVLRVILGDGRGSNFWCVIFPNICFVPDDAQAPVGPAPDGSIAEAAPADEANGVEPFVVTQERHEPEGVQYRFRFFERIGETLRSLWLLIAGHPKA